MKSVAQIPQLRVTIEKKFSLSLILPILAFLVAFFLGVAIGIFNPEYGIAVSGVLMMTLIVLLRWDELAVTLIIVVHIFIDWYLDFHLVSALMALILLIVYSVERSADRPWVNPRPIWLWGLFLTLTIYPAIKGGSLDLYDAGTFYPDLIFSAFIMFWLGSIIAKNISHVRRVFQLLSALAVFIAIHTVIEATTGKFLFESARAEVALAQHSNYQLVQNLGASVSRASSFFGHPDANGIFLALSVFLPLGLFIESKQLWAKMIYLLEMLLILLALMFTYSTGSWIGVLAGILAFMFLAGRKRNSILLFVMIMLLTVIVFTIFPSQLALQLSHASAQNEGSLHIAVWQTAVRITEAFPLFGIGLSYQAYLIAQESFRVPAQIIFAVDPNNSYLQWGAMAGIPVMLIFLSLLGYVFWFSWRNWQIAEIRYRPVLGGGIAALISLSVTSFDGSGWTSPNGTASFGWLVFGVLSSPLLLSYFRETSQREQQPQLAAEGVEY
jgi:hypothetical protein